MTIIHSNKLIGLIGDKCLCLKFSEIYVISLGYLHVVNMNHFKLKVTIHLHKNIIFKFKNKNLNKCHNIYFMFSFIPILRYEYYDYDHSALLCQSFYIRFLIIIFIQ